MADQFLAEIYKIPPVTRFICGSTLAVTVPVLLKVLSPYRVLFVAPLVLGGEVWRVPSSFFYGGSGLGFLFDFVMLYRNSNAVEESHYAGRSYDYAWHLFLASLGILALNIPFTSYFHFRPLLVTLAYLSSALQPEAQISLMGILSLPAKYFPYVLVAMDGVMAGPTDAARALTGVIVGHCWWLAQARGVMPGAPGWVRRLVGAGGVAPAATAGGSGVVNPGSGGARAGGVVGAGSSGSSGVLNPGRGAPPRTAPAPARGGYNWGSGRRLGE